MSRDSKKLHELSPRSIIANAAKLIEHDRRTWLLVIHAKKFTVLNLDECVTAPELKIGGEVAHAKFGSGTLVALSNDKQHLQDNANALAKAYNNRTQNVDFNPQQAIFDTAEIHLNDMLATLQVYKNAIYREIQCIVYSPIMDIVTNNDFLSLFFDDDAKQETAAGKDESEAKESKPKETETGNNSRIYLGGRQKEDDEDSKQTDRERRKAETGSKNNRDESNSKKTTESKDTEIEKDQESEAKVEEKEKNKEEEEDEDEDEDEEEEKDEKAREEQERQGATKKHSNKSKKKKNRKR